MPFFQDEDGRGPSTPPSRPTFTFPGPIYRELRRKPSEESIRTDLCEGPLLSSPVEDIPTAKDGEEIATHQALRGVCDRIELIQRLKRGESPTWSPKPHLETITPDHGRKEESQETNPSARRTTPLLPPAEIKASPERNGTSDTDLLQIGIQIERAGSALHTGDFTEARPKGKKDFSSEPGIDDSRPIYNAPSPWLCTSPPRHYTPFQHGPHFTSLPPQTLDLVTRSRGPSLSSSYSSSFVFKPPTSPLVYSESNDDVDFSAIMEPIDIEADFSRNQRRHTFHPYVYTPSTPSGPFSGLQLPYQRRDLSYPYQAHQPRRSLTLNRSLSQVASTPQTPASSNSRRRSVTSDSPLHHASMVGSYEESILRGRMSTTPSRPLDFVAQIGVLGLGKCKSNLKCPPHVSLSFPAVFYSYATTAHGRPPGSEDGPSPYVGQIDLENGLPHVELDDSREAKRSRRSKSRIRSLDAAEYSDGQHKSSERDKRRAQKQKRRSTSPKSPPGGSYRIPEKGQLQIIIKNPNKTAVKLFLVPYDLAGMEAGTKTFIRQRSYSTGPIIDLPGTASKPQDATKERGTLRYLIHLHICCPTRGKYFLYKTVRVVFANRVPDGKEKLQNEIQFPEPRFTVYKPGRESAATSAAPSPASEQALRRRSSGHPLGPSRHPFESIDGVAQSPNTRMSGTYLYPYTNAYSTTPVEPISFSLYRRDAPSSNLSSESSRLQTAADSGTSSSWNSTGSGSRTYDKLSKGDVGYGGNAFVSTHKGHRIAAEGLLARKLKGLGVGKNGQDATSEDTL